MVAKKNPLKQVFEDKKVIMFHNPNCPHCTSQIQELDKYLKKNGVTTKVNIVDVTKPKFEKSAGPQLISDSEGMMSTPTWLIKDKVTPGSLKPEKIIKEYFNSTKKLSFGQLSYSSVKSKSVNPQVGGTFTKKPKYKRLF